MKKPFGDDQWIHETSIGCYFINRDNFHAAYTLMASISDAGRWGSNHVSNLGSFATLRYASEVAHRHFDLIQSGQEPRRAEEIIREGLN